MGATVETALDGLVAQLLAASESKHGALPRQAYDPEWPSPCQVGAPGADGMIRWRPVKRAGGADFSGLEHALEVRLHDDIKAYFGRYWCDVLEARSADGGLSLIQVWNEADFERLLTNIIGHAFAKRQAGQPLTVFFACTDEAEYFLSVDNDSGGVLLESPGEPPQREVAPSLAEFLGGLRLLV